MLVKLRHVLIAAKYQPSHPDQPAPEEIHANPLGLGARSGVTAKVESSGTA
jgi:hypothetical protein